MDGIGGFCGRDFSSKDEKLFEYYAGGKTSMGFWKTSFGVYSLKVEDFFHFFVLVNLVTFRWQIKWFIQI
jgi:hypothetical protein